jgi:site-specific DNA-methyltransferase (adenine-specific)
MYHRLAAGIEDAGFEIRDTLMWLYGSGFPKSHNLKGDWQGWGTALKPAVEPIVLARKPLIGTVAENVMTHGTGALNIDATRIGTQQSYNPDHHKSGGSGYGGYGQGFKTSASGRWPANILLDEEAAALLDEQSGESASTMHARERTTTMPGYGGGWKPDGKIRGVSDIGGASRFFYVAKASRSERNSGLDGFKFQDAQRWSANGGIGDYYPDGTPRPRSPERNIHPTVKPVDLMRYLIRLVTPKGGTVLDPFMGSGTTAVAAIQEGVNWIGCEREPEYVAIIEARIAAAQPGMGLNLEEDTQ